MKRLLTMRWAVALLLVLGIALTCLSFKGSDDRTFQMAKNLDIFNSIVKELDLFYVDTIDPNKTIREGIEAMLYSLDPYTNYFPEEDQSELEQMLKNSYGGIGSIITWNPKLKRSMISEPYEGMPAAEVGLKAGDILMSIDGKDLAGKNNQEVSEMLRGQVGTDFKLKVKRPGTEKELEFDIVRRSIQLPIIPYYTVLENQIGYINLSTFSGDPSKEFKQAFLDLKKQGIKSLVIDLRNNGGGLLDEAVEIANFFLPRGETLVTTKGKIKQASNTYKTLREPLDLDIPLAVLVNSVTASSSEILAGSLQDLDRAVIVGTRTYGKGLVQTTRPLPYGATMKITTSKYYIPSGRCVQAIDYAHRNEDGSVGRIPDSLTTVFHTAAGREVRDGGGVTPDIVVKQEKLPNILFYLVNDNLIFDGLCDGIFLFNQGKIEARTLDATAFGILQAGRVRTSKTEYISCPGCGRTLYDLQSTIARIKAATSHLKGLKIGIMGCIVNGPGEMADADYGYVGAGRGKVSLYKKKECIEKNIPEAEAVDKLIELIKANGDYTEAQ